MDADLHSYLESWSDELNSRANRVRSLIGEAHWLSDGHHKEAIIREFLRRYLSPKYIIERGFIRPTEQSERTSTELDILISDPELHPPFFHESAIQISPPSSVLAHFEVKTEFTKPNLLKSLATQIATQSILDTHVGAENVWRALVFAHINSSRTPVSTLKTIRDTLSNRAALIKALPSSIDQLPAKITIDHLPKCITTFSPYIIYLSSGQSKFECKLHLFDLGKLSLASAFIDLFSWLITRSGNSVRPSELTDLMHNLSPKAAATDTLDLKKVSS